MSGTATGAVQTAVYSRLNVAAVTGLAGLYDEPPEGTAFPYVLIGDVIERADNRMGGKVGKDLTLLIHAWTDKRGFSTLHDLIEAVDDLLDNYALVVTGYVVNLLNFEDVQLLREGLLRHAVIRYRINLVEN